jgi:uncharacterized peroxidase-related enzyme
VKTLYIPDIERRPKPDGVYQRAIEATKAIHPEYPKIWDLFAFGEDYTGSLARFTQGVLRTPASLSPGMRELIAAYTSRLNDCAFCTKAHAAAASELLGSEELVASVLADREASPLEESHKALLRFVEKVTHHSADVTAADMEPLRAIGWGRRGHLLRHHYLRSVQLLQSLDLGTGVPAMSDEMHRWQGKLLATGYIRG